MYMLPPALFVSKASHQSDTQFMRRASNCLVHFDKGAVESRLSILCSTVLRSTCHSCLLCFKLC